MTDSAVALGVHGAGKHFGATRALDDVSFDVLRGEVHALLGHNGSGKSTLVKVVSGFQDLDSGSIHAHSADGGPARVGVVHQDLALCATASVVENCGMGNYRRRAGMIDWAHERRAVRAVLESLGATVGLDDLVGELGPADQAIVAIARALKVSGGDRGLDLLVLDEATAALRGRDADTVLSAARRVAARGGGVLLVTHHMSEVLAVADRATVLSSGRVVDTVDVDSVDEDDLLRLVGGGHVAPAVQATEGVDDTEPEVLRVDGLSGREVHDLSFRVRPGEIVGLTGAAGAGHDEVPYLVADARLRIAGEVTVDQVAYAGRSVRDALRSRLGVLPADRLRQGVLLGATIRENLSPTSRPEHRTWGLLRVRREKAWARRTCVEYGVVPPEPEIPLSSLSGGNQQKVLFARVLEHGPRVLVLHEPTQGVDEHTRRALMSRVRGLVDDGLAVLYVSSDPEEVAECADRVLVLRQGALVAELRGGRDRLDDVYAACYSAARTGVPAANREEIQA